jgi:hypothetical protein
MSRNYNNTRINFNPARGKYGKRFGKNYGGGKNKKAKDLFNTGKDYGFDRIVSIISHGKTYRNPNKKRKNIEKKVENGKS